MLLKQSHIIPTFLLKGIKFDKEKRTMMHIQSSPKVYPKQKGFSTKLVQTGWFEKDILCAECDNEKLGNKLEGYMANHIFPKIENCMKRGLIPETDIPFFDLGSLDNLKIIKFLLSLLWRVSLSKQINIKLPPQWEEDIRQFLMDESEDAIQRWSICLMRKDPESSVTSDVVLPQGNKEAGYSIIIGVYMLFFLQRTSKQAKQYSVMDIPQKGPIWIPILRDRVWKSMINALIHHNIKIMAQNMGKEGIEEYLKHLEN